VNLQLVCRRRRMRRNQPTKDRFPILIPFPLLWRFLRLFDRRRNTSAAAPQAQDIARRAELVRLCSHTGHRESPGALAWQAP
jgi:hypothetical protein